jgi:hypothetical protein
MVSVVYPGQVLRVPTPDGNDFARCQVLGNDDNNARSSAGGCCRLVAATQVVVLPPARPSDDLDDDSTDADGDRDKEVCLSVLPGALDYNPSMHELASHLGVSLLSVGQGRAVVHPNAAPWIARRFSLEADAGPALDRRASRPAGFLVLVESSGPEDPVNKDAADEEREDSTAKFRRRELVSAWPMLPFLGVSSSSRLSSVMILTMLILIMHDVNQYRSESSGT